MKNVNDVQFVAIAMQLELPDNYASKYAFGSSGIILRKDLLAFYQRERDQE